MGTPFTAGSPMKQKKIYNIEVIGFGLALLYAISGLAFIKYLNIPELGLETMAYVILFGTLFIGSVAVILHKEWGRKLLLGLNAIMLVCLVARFVPVVELVPLAYLFLNVIVLLYFTQSRVRTQFHSEKYDSWNRSILVVDDDEMIGKTVRPILFSKGFSVLTAASGEDGLQIARTQKPDLILLDVILPGLKGREVCAKLKEDPQTKEIPVVFLTSKDSPEDIRAENEVGSSGHLTKPVNAKTLIDMVQGILGPGKIRKK